MSLCLPLLRHDLSFWSMEHQPNMPPSTPATQFNNIRQGIRIVYLSDIFRYIELNVQTHASVALQSKIYFDVLKGNEICECVERCIAEYGLQSPVPNLSREDFALLICRVLIHFKYLRVVDSDESRYVIHFPSFMLSFSKYSLETSNSHYQFTKFNDC